MTATVTLEATGDPVHGAVVLLIGLGQFTTTDGNGSFMISDVPPGTYPLLVEREHLTAERQDVTVRPDETVELAVTLSLSPIHEQVTVTTSAQGGSTALEQFNAVTTLDSFDLTKVMWGNIGEALQNEGGVTKRSFGPAPSRPIIRGFDNDRVLIMNDGTRTSDLSSQSADHNVTIDPTNLTGRWYLVQEPRLRRDRGRGTRAVHATKRIRRLRLRGAHRPTRPYALVRRPRRVERLRSRAAAAPRRRGRSRRRTVTAIRHPTLVHGSFGLVRASLRHDAAAFVGNLTSSYRAPALEELYNPTATPF